MGPGSDPDDETVDPGPGRDRIFGGKGRDDFCGSKLTSGDTYDGGPGPDQFCVDGRGPSNATIKGGPDRDGFFQRGKLPVTIALNDLADDDFGCANGCDGNNLGSDIELLRIEAPAGSLSGGPGDDRISVSDDSDDSDDSEGDEGAEGDGGFRFRLFGLEGNDRLIADLGPAWIDGGPGNDRIEGSDRGD
ncbi:MAG TPA: hypothetical protein VM285_12515 [Polyangia bacterium]|nr:hypothetical protein [Polyangia bacterium]